MLTAQEQGEGIAMEKLQRNTSGEHATTTDVYFSADVETDGPIPGPFSILSFGLVYAGSFDGKRFMPPQDYAQTFYRELKPISENYQEEALRVNGLDRNRLLRKGASPYQR